MVTGGGFQGPPVGEDRGRTGDLRPGSKKMGEKNQTPRILGDLPSLKKQATRKVPLNSANTKPSTGGSLWVANQ